MSYSFCMFATLTAICTQQEYLLKDSLGQSKHQQSGGGVEYCFVDSKKVTLSTHMAVGKVEMRWLVEKIAEKISTHLNKLQWERHNQNTKFCILFFKRNTWFKNTFQGHPFLSLNERGQKKGDRKYMEEVKQCSNEDAQPRLGDCNFSI